MKIIKALFILIFTLILILSVLLILRNSGSVVLHLSIATLIYGAFVYLVWPLGTYYSVVAYKRLFHVVGFGLVLFAIDVLLTNECPTLKVVMFTKSAPIEGAILLICSYFGVQITSLFIFLCACYLVYVGLKNKPSNSMTRSW